MYNYGYVGSEKGWPWKGPFSFVGDYAVRRNTVVTACVLYSIQPLIDDSPRTVCSPLFPVVAVVAMLPTRCQSSSRCSSGGARSLVSGVVGICYDTCRRPRSSILGRLIVVDVTATLYVKSHNRSSVFMTRYGIWWKTKTENVILHVYVAGTHTFRVFSHCLFWLAVVSHWATYKNNLTRTTVALYNMLLWSWKWPFYN